MDDDAGPAAEKRICLGLITGARGLKGEVWIRTFTAEPVDVAAYGPPTDDAGERRYALHVIERRDDRVVARIDGVRDRSSAEALKGTRLYVERAALPVPDEDEFYHADLIGCAVLVAAAEAGGGTDVGGRVTAVHDFGGGSVLEVGMDNGASLIVPFTRICVPEIDLVRRRVRVVPPPGLLADAAEPPFPADQETADEQ
jgi:16S rRNA processing protein RimM